MRYTMSITRSTSFRVPFCPCTPMTNVLPGPGKYHAGRGPSGPGTTTSWTGIPNAVSGSLRKYDRSSAASCPTVGAEPQITVNGRVTTPPDTDATAPKCPVPLGQAIPQSIGLSRAAWPPTARSWTCPGDTPANCTSSYAGIAGPGPIAKASERIFSARYQLLPKKDAATRLIPLGIMDHANCRKLQLFLHRGDRT